MIAILAESSKTVRIWHHQLYATANESKEMVDFGLFYTQMDHDSNVLMCKFKKQNYFECVSKYIANLIVTFTEDCKVHLWIENFAQVSFLDFH